MMRRERKRKEKTRKTQRPRATMWKVDVCGLLRVYVTVKSAESISEEG